MRKTQERGFGRGSYEYSRHGSGGRETMRRYRAAPPRRRSRANRMARALGWALLGLLVAASGLAGGLYLWFHQSVAAVRAHSADVIRAEKQLNVTLPGQASIALLLGDNQRAGIERSAGGRSDTMMLLRADPKTKTVSLLSIPRDLQVPVYCPRSSQPVSTTRIDYAFAWCGATGSLETVEKLTGLRINYLITVNFHGFKEIVNNLGGIWLDVDRRYYNQNTGTASSDYSNINLQPGYQLLSGGSALEFVRFRHTDSDFYRQARQQEFLRALKSEVTQHFDPLKLPGIVSAITHNVEVGSKSGFGDTTVLGYALFAATLPAGHILQNYVGNTVGVNVGGAAELQASPSSIQQSVAQFTHPDAGLSKAANNAALGGHATPRPHAPPPRNTTITVLNGNGVAGAAAEAGYLLAKQGYVTVPPPGGLVPNAPSENYPQTQIYFDLSRPGSRAAAAGLGNLLTPSQIKPLPQAKNLRALDPGSSLLVIVGRTFNNTLDSSAVRLPANVPAPAPAFVRTDPSVGRALLNPFIRRTSFRLEVPTILESSSTADALPGDVPARLYTIAPGHKAVRLVFHNGNAFWGIEETDLPSPPVLADRSFQQRLGGRVFQLYYAGTHLHMVALETGKASYWVVNTLLDALSNKTMLAIAEGLRPLPAGA